MKLGTLMSLITVHQNKNYKTTNSFRQCNLVNVICAYDLLMQGPITMKLGTLFLYGKSSPKLQVCKQQQTCSGSKWCCAYKFLLFPLCISHCRHLPPQFVNLERNMKSTYKRGHTSAGNVSYLTKFQLACQRRSNKMATPTKNRILFGIFTPFAGKHAP